MKLIFFCLSLILTTLFSITFASSPTVSKLESDTRDLKVNIGKLQKKVDEFKDKLEVFEQRLSIPSHLAHDLGQIDDTMGDVKKVATVGKIVPPIKGQAAAVVDGIDVTQPPVTKTKEVMEKIAEAVEPVREGVKKAIKKIEEIQKKVNKFKAKKITPFYKKVVSAQQCVDKADKKHHACMQKKLDGHAKTADKVVGTADQALETVLKDIAIVEATIKKFEDKIKSMEGLLKKIDLLEHDLHMILGPLVKLKHLMAKKFHFKLKYPNPRNLLKKVTFKISLSGKDIIKGIKAIEKKIKKMLKGAILKAAKLFGLKKIAKKLFNLFDHPFKIIMKKLHLKIKIHLPGLNKLKGLNFNPLFREIHLGLNKLKLDLKSPEFVACKELSKTCK